MPMFYVIAVMADDNDYYGKNPTGAFVFVAIVVVLYIWIRHKINKRRK